MNQEELLRGTTRQDEEAFLEETLSVIRDNLTNYGEQVDSLRAEIDVMLDHFHDDNPELINLLENTMTLHDQMSNCRQSWSMSGTRKPWASRISAG